jgi:hypothetical protein
MTLETKIVHPGSFPMAPAPNVDISQSIHSESAFSDPGSPNLTDVSFNEETEPTMY